MLVKGQRIWIGIHRLPVYFPWWSTKLCTSPLSSTPLFNLPVMSLYVYLLELHANGNSYSPRDHNGDVSQMPFRPNVTRLSHVTPRGCIMPIWLWAWVRGCTSEDTPSKRAELHEILFSLDFSFDGKQYELQPFRVNPFCLNISRQWDVENNPRCLLTKYKVINKKKIKLEPFRTSAHYRADSIKSLQWLSC